ncbi:MAG: MFS transporter [Verrucomicrobiales bacterium]
MRPLQIQFFLSYAIVGSLSPLLSVFLQEEKGLSPSRIGVALALVSASNLISPTLMTLLADTRLQTRHILALAYLSTALMLAVLLGSTTWWLTLALMAGYGLSIVAMFPLQDGLYFSSAEEARAGGRLVIEYPGVRVWGTVGFMVPAILLYVWLHGSTDARPAVVGAISCSLLCVGWSLIRLPPVRPAAAPPGRRHATLEAMRVLARPETRWLCLGLALAAGCSATYHNFFPLYLLNTLGVGREWIPLIINLGVLLEVFYTLAFPSIRRVLGEKGILLTGLALMVLRMALLSRFPSVPVAVLVQIGHGMEIIALFVLVPMVLNRLAGDHFRNSMQGAFSMFMGGSRLLGTLIAGHAIERDILHALGVAACLGTLAWLIVALGYRQPEAGRRAGGEEAE